MKRQGRFPLDKRAVFHYENGIGECFFCKRPAPHAVRKHLKKQGEFSKDTNGMLWLCTEHLAAIFKLPANRHPKKRKEKVAVSTMPYPGYKHWSLRQHMDVPYHFSGERIACHSAKVGAWTWYWSLYWRDGGDANPIDHVLSVTRAADKKHAIHMVQPWDGGADPLVEMVKFMFHAHGTIAPIDDAELLVLTMEATKFIENAHRGKPASAYRLACIERLTAWRRMKAEEGSKIRLQEELAERLEQAYAE